MWSVLHDPPGLSSPNTRDSPHLQPGLSTDYEATYWDTDNRFNTPSNVINITKHFAALHPSPPWNDGRASSEAGGDIPGNMYEREEEEESVDTDSHTSLHLHLTLFDSL